MDLVYPGDIIMGNSHGICYRLLEEPNFESFHEAFNSIGSVAHLARRFPWFLLVRVAHE